MIHTIQSISETVQKIYTTLTSGKDSAAHSQIKGSNQKSVIKSMLYIKAYQKVDKRFNGRGSLEMAQGTSSPTL
jgi:hypothetical protein